MNDLIERQAAIETVRKAKDKSEAHRMIIQLPTVDAVPVRHGHLVRWYEEVCDSFGVAYVPHCKCSECGMECDPYIANRMNYCSNCGVKLDGKDDDNHG